ncbi:MAG: hypothetical protein IKU38_01490 [Clostridia bacterium]|nr:hypothetical protein [Clostridia bacterium]
MSGRAGHDLGLEIGKMMEHKFITMPAKVISKIGHILGMVMLVVGVMMMILDEELALPGFLIGVGGVALLLVLHWLALQIDKKHAKKE